MVQTSAWVIRGMPAAINFREDLAGNILEDGSPFLLHGVNGKMSNLNLKFQMTEKQAEIRRHLYGEECDISMYADEQSPTVTCEIVNATTAPRFAPLNPA
jgi:hypothetical protein